MLLPSQRWCGRTQTIGKSSLDLEFPTKHETLVSTTKRSFLFGKTAVNPTWRKLPLYPWVLPQLQSGTFQHASVWPEHFSLSLANANKWQFVFWWRTQSRQGKIPKRPVYNRGSAETEFWDFSSEISGCWDRIPGQLSEIVDANFLMQLTLPSTIMGQCPVLANVCEPDPIPCAKWFRLVPDQILCKAMRNGKSRSTNLVDPAAKRSIFLLFQITNSFRFHVQTIIRVQNFYLCMYTGDSLP